MAKCKDFDEFFKEKKRTLLVFKLFNKKYTLPPALPASLMTKILRAQKDDVLQADTVILICSDLLGKKQFEELTNAGVDIEQLEEIIKWAVNQYGGGIKQEDEGEVLSEDEAENFQLEKQPK